MERKAQAQVITTILIILLVLAVIVIVWQVVTRTVTESAGTLTAKSACLGVSLELKNVKCTTAGAVTATVTRGSDSVGTINMVVVTGETAATAIAAPSSLGSSGVSSSGASTGDFLRIAPVVGTQTCDPTDEEELTCTATA